MSLFDNLPRPKVIDDLDYEVMLASLLADGQARLAARGINYDVGNLEFDPFKIGMESVSFHELNLRARINDAAMTRVLPFAIGSDLDYLSAFHDVTRLADESDERLRKRVTLAISGRSTAGPADWYVSAAMRASVRVKDARVYRTGIGPQLALAILATDNGGVADPALIAAVEAVVLSDSVRVISDDISVVPAVQQSVNVAADVWLLPEASQTVITEMETSVRQSFIAEGGLGFDLKLSWLQSRLFVPGVSKLTLTAPLTDTIAGPNSAISIGTVTLTYRGRDR